MTEERYLVVTADDFGIGLPTSRGILELAALGVTTASVLLVNSPFVEESVRAWRCAGMPMELGWHPCLTLDRPILPASRVPGLVDAEGNFLTLGKLMNRLLRGKVRRAEVESEFQAQYERFQDLVGQEPTVVNSHHHVQVFSLVGSALRSVLSNQNPKPYLRRIREPWRTIVSIAGARPKRGFLNLMGRRQSSAQEEAGFPGSQWLAGITDPPYLASPDFFIRWLRSIPGRIVELTCHPGHLDATLIGRDGSLEDGQLLRRTREYELLKQPGFREALKNAGFTLVRPSTFVQRTESPRAVAA